MMQYAETVPGYLAVYPNNLNSLSTFSMCVRWGMGSGNRGPKYFLGPDTLMTNTECIKNTKSIISLFQHLSLKVFSRSRYPNEKC